jgi:hypothetical protein
MQAIEVDIQSMDNFTIGRAPYREQIDDSATTMTSGRFVASVEDMERVHAFGQKNYASNDRS